MDYNKYADEILYDFITPLLITLYKDTWKNNHLDIIVNDNSTINVDNTGYTQAFIFTLEHAIDAHFPGKVDYFSVEINKENKLISGFIYNCISNGKDYCFTYSGNRSYFGNSFDLIKESKYAPLENIDDIVRVYNILKKNMLKLYSKFTMFNIYTEKEYQIYKVSKLYEKIETAEEKINCIKEGGNLSDEDLDTAKNLAATRNSIQKFTRNQFNKHEQ